MTNTSEPSSPRFIGQRVQRVEDPRFLLGRGQYIADIKLPRMAHAAFLRSPHAHARIKRIDATQARTVPGVFAVYTADMLSGKLALPMIVPGMPPVTKTTQTFPLALDKVRFVGDPVAVVAAGAAVLCLHPDSAHPPRPAQYLQRGQRGDRRGDRP